MDTTTQTNPRTQSSADVKVPRLKALRDKRALSQQELADRSGVSRTTILKLEGGRNAWPQTVRKLARALGVDPAELQ